MSAPSRIAFGPHQNGPLPANKPRKCGFVIFVALGKQKAMEIHRATEKDISTIVSLLRVSLGESLMLKSERYWRWKHLENPFGQSPVLLAREGEILVGVRAFMRWEWVDKGRIYKAVRAVDTATHPDYQGKGIFKKLTLSLVEKCKTHGDDFVFNTPNQQSMPGYMKMGWEEAGKLPIRVGIRRPVNIVSRLLGNRGGFVSEKENSKLMYYIDHPKLNGLLKSHLMNVSIVTNISKQYLTWRYLEVPVANYVAIGSEQSGNLNGLIIGRIKQSRFGKELRITDCFLNEEVAVKDLIGQLKESRRTWGIDYTTISDTMHSSKVLGRFSVSAGGPRVTLRSLSMAELQNLKNFKSWSPSLGDLELF